MNVPLFVNFLKDPREYDNARQHWKTVWRDVMGATDQGAYWVEPWMKETFANGNLRTDGNPIFSARSPYYRKAIRVIQHDVYDADPCFIAWLDDLAVHEDAKPERLQELVMSLYLDGNTKDQAFRYMIAWVRGDIDTEFDLHTGIHLPRPATTADAASLQLAAQWGVHEAL